MIRDGLKGVYGFGRHLLLRLIIILHNDCAEVASP